MNKIKELNADLMQKDRIIENFKKEMLSANKRLESLIAQINRHYKLLQKLQYQLVPTELPNVPGFEFSHKFAPSFINGGDYFDIYNGKKNLKFGIFVSSCSGHSASALLLSVLLKNSQELDKTKHISSKKMLNVLLKELKEQLGEADRVSLIYATIDRRTLQAKISRLGSCLGYILRNNELIPMGEESPEFSTSFTEEINEEKLNLESKDQLIFVSAGLVKIQNLSGEEFGLERLYQSILASSGGVHELRNSIFMAAKKHSQGGELRQDLTVVTASVKGNVLKLATT